MYIPGLTSGNTGELAGRKQPPYREGEPRCLQSHPHLNPPCTSRAYTALSGAIIEFVEKSLALFVQKTFLVKKQASLTSVGDSSLPPSLALSLPLALAMCISQHLLSLLPSPRIPRLDSSSECRFGRDRLLGVGPLGSIEVGFRRTSLRVSGAFLWFLALSVFHLPIRHEQHQHPGSAVHASPPLRDSHRTCSSYPHPHFRP